MPKNIPTLEELNDRTIFSAQEAAIYAGISKATLLNHVYVQKRITPARLNARLLVFSRDQLDDYIANDRRTDILVLHEDEMLTFGDAAAFLGLTLKEMRALVDEGKVDPIDGTMIGGQFIYALDQLKRVKGNLAGQKLGQEIMDGFIAGLVPGLSLQGYEGGEDAERP